MFLALDIKVFHDGVNKASNFVIEGLEQIMVKEPDEMYGISPSPGATALATLALIMLGKDFKNARMRGVNWLKQNVEQGWGKYPGDKPDREIMKITNMVICGKQGGWQAKLILLLNARQLSGMVLSLGEAVVPGLVGPKAEEILLPTILEDRVLAKLPSYGRPVVVAAATLATDSQEEVEKGANYLLETQMPDGSWSEDIAATSLAILALKRAGHFTEHMDRAGRWLVQKQYKSGGWPAFDQLKTWAIGWGLCVFGEITPQTTTISWISQAVDWLKRAQNMDGSYGTTPPFTHPDIDDTAVALTGLHEVGQENQAAVDLLKRLQNTDGSWGTFPSFEGRPPEISSQFPVYIPSVDVSIHVLEALWQSAHLQDKQIQKGFYWVLSQQDTKGAFPVSWYEGTVYSTAQALELIEGKRPSWARWNNAGQIMECRNKTLENLIQSQNNDGGWGSVAETGLAISSLLRFDHIVSKEIIDKGIQFLLEAQKSDGSFKPSYKGVYAKGWNYEEPLSIALTAIRAFKRYQIVCKL